MIRILEHTRRPDITFYRSGRILISARIVILLGLSSGDCVNIASDRGELLIFPVHLPDGCDGRYAARCKPTNKGSRTFFANSVKICSAMLQYAPPQASRIAFPCGQPLYVNDIVHIPIITKLPL